MWLWDFSSALFLLLWETEWIASNFCHSVPHTAQHTAFKKESCPFVSGFLVPREIKATLCFKSNEQAMEAIWGKDVWKERTGGVEGLGLMFLWDTEDLFSNWRECLCLFVGRILGSSFLQWREPHSGWEWCVTVHGCQGDPVTRLETQQRTRGWRCHWIVNGIVVTIKDQVHSQPHEFPGSMLI